MAPKGTAKVGVREEGAGAAAAPGGGAVGEQGELSPVLRGQGAGTVAGEGGEPGGGVGQPAGGGAVAGGGQRPGQPGGGNVGGGGVAGAATGNEQLPAGQPETGGLEGGTEPTGTELGAGERGGVPQGVGGTNLEGVHGNDRIILRQDNGNRKKCFFQSLKYFLFSHPIPPSRHSLHGAVKGADAIIIHIFHQVVIQLPIHHPPVKEIIACAHRR